MADQAAARWQVAPRDELKAAELAVLVGIRPLTAQLLLNRGVVEPDAARRYLEPRLADLRRPDGDAAIHGFEQAVGRLARAIVGRELIGLFGDYDVDGVTSCALLTAFLRSAGGHVVPRLARRHRGYGFGTQDLDDFAADGVGLVVTCDCGTSDHPALLAARASGIDAIVVDHHQVPDREPEAFVLLNPHQASCRFPYKGLASVGVAFYLAAALRTRLRDLGWPKLPDPRLLLDLVAIGTIQDLAPLTEENRILVHAGLRELARGRRPGLRALAELAGLPGPPSTAREVSFRLGPRLNAPGRLGDAQLALDLLLAEDPLRARELAVLCEVANQQRQKIQAEVFAEAVAQAETKRSSHVVLVAGQGWHPGVVGIVAAKLLERYGKPAAVVALDSASGTGSARATPGFHWYRALHDCADLLVRFGGHAAAAGFTVRTADLPQLEARLDSVAAAAIRPGCSLSEVTLDAEVELDELDESLARELERLAPFGVGNPEPRLGARDVVLVHSRVVKEHHLQVLLRAGPCALGGIGFGLAPRDPGSGARVRAAFVPLIDTFRGEQRLRLRLWDLALEDGIVS